jgi:hypothetical protein
LIYPSFTLLFLPLLWGNLSLTGVCINTSHSTRWGNFYQTLFCFDLCPSFIFNFLPPVVINIHAHCDTCAGTWVLSVAERFLTLMLRGAIAMMITGASVAMVIAGRGPISVTRRDALAAPLHRNRTFLHTHTLCVYVCLSTHTLSVCMCVSRSHTHCLCVNVCFHQSVLS